MHTELSTGASGGPGTAPRTALVTGASAGLGRALTAALVARGWRVVVDARGATALGRAVDQIRAETPTADIDVVPGDVTEPEHRVELAARVGAVGDPSGALLHSTHQPAGLDLLVHNASTLGPTGLHPLVETSPEELRDVLETNVVAPVALTRLLLPALVRARGIVLTISSDAGVEHYETWGAYGASKAALDHVAGTLAAENPGITAYALDPGDMRTAMHQAAFPGEDISDRPLPETVVGPILELVEHRPPSGRYRVADLTAGVTA